MRIGGPRSLFSDPAILALLALHAGKDAADVYKAYDAKHSQDLLAKAYLTGQPVMSEPGGTFRQLASKLTGGYISPDRIASGSDLMQQGMMLDTMRRNRMGEQESALKLREGEGAQTFEQLYGNRYNFPSVLPKEAHQAKQEALAQSRFDYEKQKNDPNAKIQEKVKEKEALGPIELKQAISKKTAEENVDLSYKPRIAAAEADAKLAREGSSLGLAVKRAVGEAGAEGAATGRVNALENTKIGNIKDQVFYDPKDYRNITNKSPNLTWKQAHDMNLLPVKPGSPQEANIKNAIEMHNAVDKMRELIPKVFPMSVNSGSARYLGSKHTFEGASNDQLTQFNSYRDKVVGYVKSITGRVSVPEVQLSDSYFPRTGTPLFGHLPTQVDTQKEANDKLDKMLKDIDTGVRGGVFEGINTDADYDRRKAIEGAAGE